MVGKRRFGLLMASVVLGLFVLWVRLFQVQVVEHEVWATQAANLVRSAKLLPHHRGRILDRQGRALAYDDEYYQIELVYRDFRRGHPLGQVAHARSNLEKRPVGLDEALETLEDWAIAIVELSPNQLLEFGRGAELMHERFVLPASADPIRERRSARAADLHYYAAKLLLSDDTRGRLQRKLWRKRGEPEGNQSFLELVASLQQTTPELVREELTRRLRDARSDLGRLGALLDYGKETGEAPLIAIVHDLEGARALVEDSVADELFREAAGFSAGRIETETLLRIDLEWIAGQLAWDEPRLEQWAKSRREGWRAWVESYGLYRGLLQIDLAYEVGDPAQRLLSELAGLFARRPRGAANKRATDWREFEELAVLSELPNLFDVPDSVRLMEAEAFELRFQNRELRESPRHPNDPWGFVASVLFDPETAGDVRIDEQGDEFVVPASVERLAETWRGLSEAGRLHSMDSLRHAKSHFHMLEARLQAEVSRRVEILAQNALAGPDAPIPLASFRRTAALKKARHILRDQSSRPALVAKAPEYSVVQLVTRWHERYAGIEVRTRTRRLYPAVDEHGTPYASGLLGTVREANLREVLSQRGTLRELDRLQKKRERTPEEDRRILELAARIHHPEEQQGGAGLEGYLQAELQGKNGYVETQGLEERRDSGGLELFELPVDGRDVTLTLDLSIQAAAQRVLENPRMPEWEEKRDELWFANPVGSIVLVTPQGDLLAAASVPTRPEQAPEERDGERGFVRERSLTRPKHQPPGSVYKPFVALWALGNLNWSPNETTDCAALGDGGAGYESMHCHNSYGHGVLDLREAIKVSCNAYFARLGEHYSADELRFMAQHFGFGEPTGIQALDGLRSGLREDATFRGFETLSNVRSEKISARMKRQIGNGLSLVEATPCQVARATCGLLTNELPELRLVHSIDGEELPYKSRTLGFSGDHLMRVQEAMDAVVNETSGSAFRSIGSADLPFRVAGKTGSADYRRFKPGTGPRIQNKANKKTRKHTWFAGWFPADNPKAVLIVYLHDVAETSSHTSVHVAQQFLESPEVQAFVGVE